MSKNHFVLECIKSRFKFFIKSGSSVEDLDDFERVYRLAFEHALSIVVECENCYGD